MEKSAIIASIVLVFVVGFVFGSFSGLTEVALGRATSNVQPEVIRPSTSTAIISILPDIARPNDIMSGTVFPGRNGATSGIRIYNVDQFGSLGSIVDECRDCFCANSNVCYNQHNYNYILPQLEPGFYGASVTDAVTNERVYAMFQVR